MDGERVRFLTRSFLRSLRFSSLRGDTCELRFCKEVDKLTSSSSLVGEPALMTSSEGRVLEEEEILSSRVVRDFLRMGASEFRLIFSTFARGDISASRLDEAFTGMSRGVGVVGRGGRGEMPPLILMLVFDEAEPPSIEVEPMKNRNLVQA